MEILRLFLLALAVFTAVSCASSKDTLQLENIFDLKAERQARLEARARAESLGEGDAGAREGPAGKDAAEAVRVPDFDPPELKRLVLPEGFVLLEKETLESDAVRAIRQKFPQTETAWKSSDGEAYVFAGKTRTDAKKIRAMTREKFMAELQRTAEGFNAFYGTTYGAKADYEIREAGPLFAVTITSKFLHDGAWRTDQRRFYFYKPEYRLSFLISGKDADLRKAQDGLETALADFENALGAEFPQGIRFTTEVDVMTPETTDSAAS